MAKSRKSVSRELNSCLAGLSNQAVDVDMENVIELQDKRYPKLLKKIIGPPEKFYYKGEWDDEIFKSCLAVVGSRRLTSYGRRITELLVSEIASAGVTIVSGFMYGGDAAAHKAAVDVGGRTIAVMPCGIKVVHPADQEELYKKILENRGLVISEFAGDFLPVNWTYVQRNRIVAGLSKAVLIVEAGLNSGTMITANYAKKFNRKILAVPGPLTSEVSLGTAQLIKEGAEVVVNAQDVLKYFPFVRGSASHKIKQEERQKEKEANDLEGKIVNYLKREALTADGLARTLALPVARINANLSLLQLKGFIKQEGDKYYSC